MSSLRPLSPNSPSPTLPAQHTSGPSRPLRTIDSREAMQSEYGMSGEHADSSRTTSSFRSDQPVVGVPQEVSRAPALVPPYQLQQLGMSYNKDFTTNPMAYATTGQAPATTQMSSAPAHHFHPYRTPHASSPPVMFGHQNMLGSLPPGLMQTPQEQSSPYAPFGYTTSSYPSSQGSISSVGSALSSFGSSTFGGSSFGSTMSDMSSTSGGYSPPMQPPQPLPSLGYANPRELQSFGRRPRKRVHRRPSPKSDLEDGEKMLQENDDDDDDDDENDEQERGVGFSIGVGGNYEAFAPIDKAEAGRLSRIKSEQKRRNVLKEGFERLRSMLPPTNQKASKQALLDRAVAHLAALGESNNFLMEENRKLKGENEEMRRTNLTLIRDAARSRGPAVTMHPYEYDFHAKPGPNGHSSSSNSTGSAGSTGPNAYGGRS